MVRYSLRSAAVVDAYSALIGADSNDAEHVNGIAVLLLQEYGLDADTAWRRVGGMVSECEAVLAHNADFDRQWVGDGFPDVPWIDTCGGVRWPLETRPGMALDRLCLAHGLAVVDPHRALSDCMLIARLLSRCAELGHSLEEILAWGLRPTAVFQALVPIERKDEAKAAGFRWEPKRKRWLRKMAIEDTAALPFAVEEVRA